MKKITITIITVLFLMSLLTSCGKSDKGSIESCPHSLAVVVQYTANTAEPMLSSSEVVNTIYDAALCDGSSITIIEADGAPYTVDSLDITVKSNLSDAKKSSIAKQVTGKTIQIAETAFPKTAQVDTLKALTYASRNIDSDASVKTILYLGSAIQTTGELSFADQNLFDADVDFIIDQLKEIKAIPSFPEGTRVIFAGVGDVIDPQPELTYENIDTLKQIWRRICEEGGAEVEFISATPITETDTSLYPEVSTVAVTKKYVVGAEITPEDVFTFDSESISFKPDSHELTDRESVKELLQPIVDHYKGTDNKLLVSGTTATVGSNDDCVIFSKMRSDTIAQLLFEMGLDNSQVETVGLGYENKYHVPDLNADGTLNESEAAKNRMVIIMPMPKE